MFWNIVAIIFLGEQYVNLQNAILCGITNGKSNPGYLTGLTVKIIAGNENTVHEATCKTANL